jgi:Predicted AAA-ATPase/PD-(D/E)XK nuclease superfamily
MKKFNDTGVCIPEMHYMVDTSAKVEKILQMVADGDYFTINRPRQFGKTTISFSLAQALENNPQFLLLEMSFEGIGDLIFEEETGFCLGFMDMLIDKLDYLEEVELVELLEAEKLQTTTFKLLSKIISGLCKKAQRKVVVIIDEVDKSSNNQLFLSFIGMLRDKYLARNKKREVTFQSVILIGVHDVKSLKQKINPESKGKLNSPWNIAVDFKVDLSFRAKEIESMLIDYSNERQVEMDVPAIATRIYYYTSGYPYLVSKICKFIAEDILPEKENQSRWTLEEVDAGFKKLTYGGYTTTLFDSLFKYLEGYDELYELAFNLIISGKSYHFTLNDPVINLAFTYGIIKDQNGFCQVHNRVFEQRMYDYFLSRQITKYDYPLIPEKTGFIEKNQLNISVILRKFQAFMQENYATKDTAFLEREGRLLFLSFLKPIINGKGFDFKEPVVGDERRMDLVITFQNHRYIIELKRWEGESYHQEGLQQLSDYLDLYQLKKGYILIFDFRKNKQYKEQNIQFADKEIFAVWV